MFKGNIYIFLPMMIAFIIGLIIVGGNLLSEVVGGGLDATNDRQGVSREFSE